MGFLAPSLLPLAALAAIPVVIHILSRLRLKRAEFPSLLLLTTVKRERFSWLRLKELLLLVFRTLALLALLLALARPYVRHRLPGLGRTNDLVVILDDSYSMGRASQWQRALAVSRGLLSSLGPGRRAALLVASQAGLFNSSLLSPPSSFLPLLDSLRPSCTEAVLEPALRRAMELAEPAHADIAVVTDLQVKAVPSDWRPPTDVPVTLVSVSGPNANNAGVTRVYTEDRFPVAGQATRIKADFANYGPHLATRTAILTLDDRREEQAVTIKPHASATVTFEAVSADSGYHVAEVELRTDSLEADNTRWLAFRQPRRIPVLVVESPAVPATYLADALGADSSSVFSLTRIAAPEFGRYDPRRFSTVVVTDAAALSRPDWTRLGFFLQSGGSALVMFGNPPSDSLLLAGRIRFLGSARPSGFVSVASADTTHPVLDILKPADLSVARFFAHARLERAGGRVLARLSDGEPLIVAADDGRLVTWAFTVLPEFTDLVFKAAFVPLLHRTLLYLAGGGLVADYLVGDTIRAPVVGAGPVAISTPDGRVVMEPEMEAGRPEVAVARTGLPGIYRVDERPYAVNVFAAEGDLTQVPTGKLEKLGYRVWSASDSRQSPIANRQSSDLSPVLLWIAALAFAAELLLLAL
ncbi:BatA domain-containing protein [candidate division WOR-3 bacterium]|nr:BatA domain-containing protein [candidate division WOR-3 bacterium]